MSYACPQCGSQNTQRLSLAYSSGLSTVDLRTGGIGVGIGSNTIIPTFGGDWSSGSVQTQLSKSAAPPSKKKYRWALYWALLGPAVVYLPGAILEGIWGRSMSSFLGEWMIAFVPLGVLWIVLHAFFYNRIVWPKLMKSWTESFVCLRCSAAFIVNRKSSDNTNTRAAG